MFFYEKYYGVVCSRPIALAMHAAHHIAIYGSQDCLNFMLEQAGFRFGLLTQTIANFIVLHYFDGVELDFCHFFWIIQLLLLHVLMSFLDLNAVLSAV